MISSCSMHIPNSVVFWSISLDLQLCLWESFSYTAGKVNGVGAALYLAAAALFLGGTPIQLKMRAKKQAVINKEYNSPAEYTFSEAGIMIRQNGRAEPMNGIISRER